MKHDECSDLNPFDSIDTQLLTDLRHLVSIAMWIRSEQLAHVGEIVELKDGSLVMQFASSAHDETVNRLRRDLKGAKKTYEQIQRAITPRNYITVSWHKDTSAEGNLSHEN